MLKKTLAIILTITTLLSLGACSFIESNIAEPTETESDVDTTVDTRDETMEVESYVPLGLSSEAS